MAKERIKKNCVKCYANWGGGTCRLGFKTMMSAEPAGVVARQVPAEVCPKPTVKAKYLQLCKEAGLCEPDGIDIDTIEIDTKYFGMRIKEAETGSERCPIFSRLDEKIGRQVKCWGELWEVIGISVFGGGKNYKVARIVFKDGRWVLQKSTCCFDLSNDHPHFAELVEWTKSSDAKGENNGDA